MLTLTILAGAVAAANNAFTYPAEYGVIVNAGDSFNIKWENATGSTASLTLRTGDQKVLQTVQTIASNIPNQGSYTWQIPTDITTGSYSIEIEADNQENYSPYFTINSSNKNETSSSTTSSAQPSTSANSTSMTTSMPMTNSSSSSTQLSTAANSTTSSMEWTTSMMNSTSTMSPFVNSTSTEAHNSTSSRHSSAKKTSEAKTTSSMANSTKSSSTHSSKGSKATGSATDSSASPSNAANLQSWAPGAVAGGIAAAFLLI